MNYVIFIQLALVLFATKVLSIIMRKLGLPQVLGMLIAGILLGFLPKIFEDTTVLTAFSEIGVVMIMFTAGLETDLREIKKNGVASLVITSLGVIVPMGVGIGVACILPGLTIVQKVFVGTILTATSVGITVACLKEMGKLHGKVGSSIVTAAILDDIIGIVILAFVTGNTESSTLGFKFMSLFNVTTAGAIVVSNVLLFFVFVIVVGVGLHYIFKWMSKKYPHTRRLSILGLVACFFFAWASEELFGVASITGAFMAGMMMSNMKQTEYIERRIDINAYMIFSPIFFASIGIGLDFTALKSSFTVPVLLFSLAFVIFGMAAKLIGCGAGALACKFKGNEGVKVGLGMMVRGEVCLIVANKGISLGLIDDSIMPAVILLVVVSSLLTPILLKLMYKKYPEQVAVVIDTPVEVLEKQEVAEEANVDIPVEEAVKIEQQLEEQIKEIKQEETASVKDEVKKKK